MGKTTTAKMFAQMDIPVWDADAVVARLYAIGGHAVAPVSALIAGSGKHGAIDKIILKAAIKQEPRLLKQLEAIVHPLVQDDRAEFIKQHSNAEIILFDIPLLFETGGDKEMDHVVVVSTSPDLQKKRVLERGTMDEETFEMILQKQMPDSEKRKRADTVIDTTTLEVARQQVEALIVRLRGVKEWRDA